jgi:putative intracellular protease/amidase
LGLLLAKDEAGKPLVKGRRLTAVTDKQVEELGIAITPQHPERELRSAGAAFESNTAFRDLFANHVVVDGRLVTGQNQNAGSETAQKMMMVAGGSER